MTTDDEKNTEVESDLGTGEVRFNEDPEEVKKRQAIDEAAEAATAAAVAHDVENGPSHREKPPSAHEMGLGGATLKSSFTDRFRKRTGSNRRDEAFRSFFEVAGEMNEFAHSIGIKGATLDAASGEVTVTFTSREAAQSA